MANIRGLENRIFF